MGNTTGAATAINAIVNAATENESASPGPDRGSTGKSGGDTGTGNNQFKSSKVGLEKDGLSTTTGTVDGAGIAIVVAIILVSGWVGGLGARLIAEESLSPEEIPPAPRAPPAGASAPAGGNQPGAATVLTTAISPLTKHRFVVLGVIAAACVPLFLSLVDSRVVGEILRQDDDWGESALVFVGLCLVAALSARAFLDSLGKRVLRDLEAKVDRANENSKEAKTTALELGEERASKPVPPSSNLNIETLAVPGGQLPVINGDERRALRALVGVTFRTPSGVALDIGEDRSFAKMQLETLRTKELARVETAASGVQRWSATSLGRAAADSTA